MNKLIHLRAPAPRFHKALINSTLVKTKPKFPEATFSCLTCDTGMINKELGSRFLCELVSNTALQRGWRTFHIKKKREKVNSTLYCQRQRCNTRSHQEIEVTQWYLCDPPSKHRTSFSRTEFILMSLILSVALSTTLNHQLLNASLHHRAFCREGSLCREWDSRLDRLS